MNNVRHYLTKGSKFQYHVIDSALEVLMSEYSDSKFVIDYSVQDSGSKFTIKIMMTISYPVKASHLLSVVKTSFDKSSFSSFKITECKISEDYAVIVVSSEFPF